MSLIYDPRSHKLGRKPVRVDGRTLQFHRYRTTAPGALPPHPRLCNYLNGRTDFGAMLNDQIGDCAEAAPAHMIQCWTGSQGPGLTLADQQVLEAYKAITGYNPDDPNSDNGSSELDVLNYWRQVGIGDRKIDAFAVVDPKNLDHLREALYLFGGLYIGLALPVSAQPQTDKWDVAPGLLTGDRAPWSWGGHAVCLEAYDDDLFTCITWGQTHLISNAFMQAYCEEAYAVVSPDWDGLNQAPNGFDVKALLSDLKLLTS